MCSLSSCPSGLEVTGATPTSGSGFSRTMHRLTPPQMMRTCLVGAIEDLEEMGIITPGKLSFYNQPPNSPDLNILDFLGLFNAMLSAYWNHAPKNSIDIIKMVEQTCKDYPAHKINRVFVTLQTIYNSVIENQGNNQYKITLTWERKAGKRR
jgi:hypothetical protein